ncbi:unnamed protein product [Eretmochelys imbricata]
MNSSRGIGKGQALDPDTNRCKVKAPLDGENGFSMLVDAVMHAPVLASTDIKKTCLLYTDASMEGLGGVCYQEYPDGWIPAAYASRKLALLEKNYTVHKVKFLV